MSTTANPTQCDRLLARLQRGTGDWVPMPELACAMSDGAHGTGICVSRRIYDLRARGHLIEVRAEQCGKQKHTFYRLTQRAIALENISPAAPVVTTTAANSTDGLQTDLPLKERGGEPTHGGNQA